MKHLLVALFLIFAGNSIYSQKNKQIDELLTTYEKADQFSGSVLVAEKGKIIFEKSYGYRNSSKKEKNTNNSLYRIYSTTKIFTATAILKLEQQGRLSLDDKLSKYFPKFPKGDSITIKNMLSHTSGIPQEAEGSEYTINEEVLLKSLTRKPLDFSPGKGWNYSNSNYYLLGYIIKKVTGMEYDQAIDEIILKPLQMTHSGFHFNELKNENKAFGYEFMSGENSNEALRFKTDHPFAAGAMYSTVEDLYKFSEAFYKGKILEKNVIKNMYTPYLNDHYGLAQEVYKMPNLNEVLVGHGGGGPGYRCRFMRDVEKDIAIIVLVNSDMIPVDKISEDITSIVYNKPYKKTTIGKVDKKDLDGLEGIYSSPDATFYVNIIDGTVIINGDILPRIPLNPVTKTFYKIYETNTFNFNTDQTEKVKSITVSNPMGVKNAEKISNTFPWGIIGNATPSGWDGKDIILQTRKDNPDFYYLKNYKLKMGELRFRLNSDWSNSLALNNDDKSLCYDGYNINIKEDGFYDIVLDMTIKSKPKYSIKLSVQ
jgi:CubicO group peptidase (beta-lactamase class C family)